MKAHIYPLTAQGSIKNVPVKQNCDNALITPQTGQSNFCNHNTTLLSSTPIPYKHEDSIWHYVDREIFFILRIVGKQGCGFPLSVIKKGNLQDSTTAFRKKQLLSELKMKAS